MPSEPAEPESKRRLQVQLLSPDPGNPMTAATRAALNEQLLELRVEEAEREVKQARDDVITGAAFAAAGAAMMAFATAAGRGRERNGTERSEKSSRRGGLVRQTGAAFAISGGAVAAVSAIILGIRKARLRRVKKGMVPKGRRATYGIPRPDPVTAD